MRKRLSLVLLVPVAMSLASCANQDLVDAYKDGWTVGREVHEDRPNQDERYRFCERALQEEFGYHVDRGLGRESAVFRAYSNGCLNGAESGSGEIARSELASLVSDP